MERIAIAMQDGGAGRVRGMRRRHEREANLIFVLPPNVYVAPRRGDFCFGDFTHAPSPENLPKNDFCPLKGGSLSDGNRF
jgi:hypothetical protein